MHTRRALVASIAAAISAPIAAPAAGARVVDVFANQRIAVGGDQRTYRLVEPQTLSPGAPLAVALHGLGIDSPALMPAYSGLDEIARKAGFVLAYPASFENHWPLSFGPKMQRELAFFDALVNHLVRSRGLDPRRIYVLGMSNGGWFANVIAAQRSRHVGGLVVHSGSAGVLAATGVTTERKFPVVVAHGDADTILPVQNGRDCAAMWRRAGHPVDYAEFPGLGHIWARDRGVNWRWQRFLDAHRT